MHAGDTVAEVPSAFVGRAPADQELIVGVRRAAESSIDARLDLWGDVTRADQALLAEDLAARVAGPDVLAHLTAWGAASGGPTGLLSRDDLLEALTEIRAEPAAAGAEAPAAVPNALRQPFTPDLLADHGTTVADAIALSVTSGSMAADGAAIVGDGAEEVVEGVLDAALSGVAAVRRVVTAGRRERELHALHGDGVRAVKNVAVEVACTAGGGAAAAALLGPGVGALIDVASFGLTGGAGAVVIGPVLVRYLGKRAGAAVANAERMRPLTVALGATGRAVEEYDATVTRALADAAAAWTTIVPSHERAAARQATRLKAAVSRHASCAQHEIRSVEAAAVERIAELVDEALQAVDATGRAFRWSVLVQRRVRNWRAACSSPGRTLEETLSCLSAAPGVAREVRGLLLDVVEGRASVLAAIGAAVVASLREADQERDVLVASLATERQRLETQVRREVEPGLTTIREATSAVRRELVHTGARSEEWVREHLPVPGPA
ncbi:hypothetical protein SAMN05660690_3495 [Geodermatophilus telluris]|uniref:Uncharacterized protein n=1 Tax=Geodermatophilus telluris TaxID=1190417 RepID=A0A1G6S8W9_9ACTN|nr:hypothetical protein SAMN05660690_3495 [Geodermatophilus telluris]